MAISDKNQKQIDEFITLISKMDVPMFLGLANILKIELLDNEKLDEKGRPGVLRDTKTIIGDCVAAFAEMNNKSRREMMKTLRRAVK